MDIAIIKVVAIIAVIATIIVITIVLIIIVISFCRWSRDSVWGTAKAQDFDALLVMAAEARRKCEEANAQRATSVAKTTKKKRIKTNSVEGSIAGKVFDFESAMASAPKHAVRSIDD
jgi:hypothetical protein